MVADKWLVVGLGNPGLQYAKTRHNVGFMLIHSLAERLMLPGKEEKNFKAMMAKGKAWGRSVILAEPLTFMNLSGESVQKILAYFDIPPENMVVVYDDIDLPFGEIRLRGSGSAGTHNGMKSIIQSLGGNKAFPRLRIGIGNPGVPVLKNFVLSKFSKSELDALDSSILPTAQQSLEILVTDSLLSAQDKFNNKDLIGKN